MSSRWTGAVLTTGLITSMLVVVPATSASAYYPGCDGQHKLTWSKAQKPWTITHRRVIENYTGGSVSHTYSVQHVLTVGASVKATAGGKVGASIAIASLEEKLDVELQASGSKTDTDAASVTFSFSKDDTYVLYSGTRKATGKYTRWVCKRYDWYKTGQRGDAQSWTDEREGGVRCGATPPKNSLAAAAKKKYC